MLHPLIYVSALSLLAGAAAQEITTDSSVDISSCPFTFYGQQYKQLYVSLYVEIFIICFNDFYNPQTSQDCIVCQEVASPFTVENGVFSLDYPVVYVHPVLPAIATDLPCTVLLNIGENTDAIYTAVALINKGTQSAIYLYPYFRASSWVYNVQVNDTTVDTLEITDGRIQNEWTVINSSSCRYSGVLYKPGTVTFDPETCLNITCDETAVLQISDSTCMLDTTCTLTGPTVIDFNGQVNSVQDRCAYSLLSDPSVPNFHLLANFQERRRKDVSFLDSVTMILDGSGVVIHMEQGGVVQLNDTVLTLNSSTLLLHGVELSKNQTGVTAQLSLSSHNVSVFFDGYTAQIHLKGPGGHPSLFSGLCGNSSRSLSELRFSNHSDSGCETLYNDTADSTINCTMVTERCNLMREAPFSACNGLVDPEPYITACTDTLCQYPSVDELSCQFPEAYATACSLLSNSTVGDWWSAIDCSPPQAFCQDRICSAHEFCGENSDSETRCFCRALFASKYSSTGALGDPTVCSMNSASLTLVGCLLEDKNIDYSALHLNNQTCRGQMDELTHMVTFSFTSSNTCGAVVANNNSQIFYKNTITTQSSSPAVISHNEQVSIDFSCSYTQPDIKSMSFKIRDSSVIQHITSGAWYYTLTMKSYTDAARTKAVESSTEVLLDQRIWVELKTDGLDGSMVAVVTDSCWATSDPSPDNGVRYELIKNGCANPADQTVQVQGNGLGTSNYFSFNMFHFSGSSGDIYLHCKLQLCVKQNNNCAPVCGGPFRRRRFVRPPRYEDEPAAFITMSWTNKVEEEYLDAVVSRTD